MMRVTVKGEPTLFRWCYTTGGDTDGGRTLELKGWQGGGQLCSSGSVYSLSDIYENTHLK